MARLRALELARVSAYVSAHSSELERAQGRAVVLDCLGRQSVTGLA